MRLCFNEILYRQKYEIEIGEKQLDVLVEIKDVDSQQLTDLLVGINKDRLACAPEVESIMFKDNLDKIKEILIGINYDKFFDKVMVDYLDFFIKARLDITNSQILTTGI